MSNMKCPIKCPICGEMLQKYGEVDPDTGTSIVLGANCPKCGIGNSDIKLWQELIRIQELFEIEDAEHSMCHTQMLKTTEKLDRTRKALDVAVDKLKGIKSFYDDSYADPNFVNWYIVAQRLANDADDAIKAITALEQKDVK